jgi:hypothetical protein
VVQIVHRPDLRRIQNTHEVVDIDVSPFFVVILLVTDQVLELNIIGLLTPVE